ncbi:MAG TPA: hypothetical protein VJ624_07855, partial [Thermodesulfobacteriota bacterium]|nr:hypothetical protein [Thermodesulfobacteriota bacterium]
MTKLKKILLNPWTVGIGTTVISVFILRLIDRFTGTNLFNILLKIISSVIWYAQTILGFKVSVGTVFIICFAVGIIGMLFKKRLD